VRKTEGESSGAERGPEGQEPVAGAGGASATPLAASGRFGSAAARNTGLLGTVARRRTITCKCTRGESIIEAGHEGRWRRDVPSELVWGSGALGDEEEASSFSGLRSLRESTAAFGIEPLVRKKAGRVQKWR
jgi:hypothetical protein